MDTASPRTLQFDRFTLDPARGALRFDGRELFLRPKVFGVLCHLAENAGRLVAKDEFFRVVWRGIEVTDDSLVQCIRELRKIIADHDRRMIRTVPRRGYLLEADVRPASPSGPPAGPTPLPFRPAPLPRSARNQHFSRADADRVAAIALAKKLPLPGYEIDTPDSDVPASIRRFLGIWASTKGFVGTNRQFMFIVTHVEKEGLAGGFTVRGPPAPNSVLQNPAEAVTFTAYISAEELTYHNARGRYRVWFARRGSLIFEQTYLTGQTTMVALQPVWTLCSAERAAAGRGKPNLPGRRSPSVRC